MKILITNDDSISSEVLLPLARWAKQFGEVTVVVPKYEQSGKSHCIELRKAFEVKQVPFEDPDIKVYTVDSTPADCVRFALEGMQTTFDFVISGINRGLNLGVDVLYSGTLGAVFEAATFGLPAVALSTKSGGFGEAMEALDEIKDFFAKTIDKNNTRYYNAVSSYTQRRYLLSKRRTIMAKLEVQEKDGMIFCPPKNKWLVAKPEEKVRQKYNTESIGTGR